MVVSAEQVRSRLKTPSNSSAIADAIRHENQVRLHAEVVTEHHMASPYFGQFLQWVKDDLQLPVEKYAAFEGMCQFPLVTNATVSMVHDEYEKIFTANDSYFNLSMLDNDLKDNFMEYLKQIDIHNYFKNEVFEMYKIRPSTVYAIDLPIIQMTPWPEPFINKLPIESIHDIELEKKRDGTDRIGMLIYRAVDKFIDNKYYRIFVVYDDVSYQVWQERTDRMSAANEREFDLISFQAHDLKYCPCFFIPGIKMYKVGSDVTRKVTISASLFDLKWLLWYTTAKRVYETYGPFPIATVPKDDDESRCVDEYCIDGTIKKMDLEFGSIVTYPCPTCSKRKSNSLVGPGTVYEQESPKTKDDAWVAEAVAFTHPSTENLEYISAEIDRLEWKIYENNVGDNNEQLPRNQAVNKDQVIQSTKGKENLFLKIAKDFEQGEKFAIDTMGLLRFKNWYVSCERSYGRQFLLYTVKDLQERRIGYKTSGMPMHMVAQVREQIVQTEFHNNPYQRQRVDILNLLEPWVDLSLAECQGLQYNLIFPDLFELKASFPTVIKRFEARNTDIVEWGSALSLETKIDKLLLILIEDVKKINTGRKELPAPEKSGVKA